MSVLILVLAAASAAPDLAHLRHEAAVDHGGNRYTLSYRPEVALRTRTVGVSPGTRPSTERCMWTASIYVHRGVQGEGQGVALDKQLGGEWTIKGSVPGACVQARGAVEAALAARQDAIRAHVTQMAAADRPRALADIAAAKALALN